MKAFWNVCRKCKRQREDQTTVQQTRDIVLHDAFLSNVFPTCANYLRILGRSSKKVAISPFLMELQAFIGMPKEDCWVDAQLPNLQVNTVNQWNGSLKKNIHTAVGKRNSPDLKISATEIWFGTPNLSKVSISVRRHRSGQEWDRTQHLLVTSASRLQHNFPGRNAMPCQQ